MWDKGSHRPSVHEMHVLFYIKIDYFRHEAWLVAGEHMTKAPATMAYASVVSRETIRIALVTIFNDHEEKLAGILNAYFRHL